MKKISTFLGLFIALGFAANAQYYFNTINPAGQNPGGLNTDAEQPGEPGYLNIIAPGTTSLQWSPNQTIPFSFNFNGSPVTQYKVSNSGVVTFTTSATTVPSFTNASLPNNSIPNNSVMIWGLQQFAGNDVIRTKTFGTAPNRQHWIYFASFSAPTASGQQWTYWGIALEETTNKIYMVDMRTFNTPLSLTIGVQVNSTTAYQIASAPNTPSFVTNGGNASTPADNVYYEFIPGTRPAADAELLTLNLNSTESRATPISISGTMKNAGSDTLNSVILNWTADNGTTINRDTLNPNLLPQSTLGFAHSIDWAPSTAGLYYDVEVWTSMPNGVMDQNTINDSLEQRVFVINGTTVQKTTIIEEFTTAVCQFCPDGAVVVENILATNPNAVASGVHSCFGTDAMTNIEATTLCNVLGINAAPTAMVDRKLFPGEAEVAFGRGGNAWVNRCASQANLGSGVDVSLSGTYDNVTRALNVTVSANMVDFVEPGDIRVSLMLVEDSVVGSGQGYNQVNAYNNTAGHPYQGAGNPILNYPHRHVLRDILPNTWGQTNVIPANYALNTPYNQTFNPTLPTAWDPNKMYLIAAVNYFGGTNIADYQILNVNQVKLNNLTVGVKETANPISGLKIYPNPSSLPFTTLEFHLNKNASVEASIMDITGKQVQFQDFGTMVKGNQRIQLNVDALNNGFYFVNLNINGEIITRKISILK